MYKTSEMFSLLWTYMLLVQQKPAILHFQEYYLQQYEVCTWSLSGSWLFATPWAVAQQAPLRGIFQGRILEQVVISFSRRPSQPRDQACVSCTGRWITTVPPGKLKLHEHKTIHCSIAHNRKTQEINTHTQKSGWINKGRSLWTDIKWFLRQCFKKAKYKRGSNMFNFQVRKKET